jgi:PAS domain S-box-containing protein
MTSRKKICHVTSKKQPASEKKRNSKKSPSRRTRSEHLTDELLEHTYTKSPVPIGICDSEGRFVDVNIAWLRMFGLQSVGEMAWSSLFDMPGLEDRVCHRLGRLETVSCETQVDHAAPGRESGNAWMNLSLSIVPLNGTATSSPRGYVVHAQDTSDRRRAEHELSERIDELKLSEAALGGRLSQIVEQHHAIREMLIDLETSKDELESANARLRAELSESGRLEGILRENEKKLRAVLDSIVAGVVITNTQTSRIADVNLAAAEMIGLRKSQIIGRPRHGLLCIGSQICSPMTGQQRSADHFRSVLLTHDGRQLPILRTTIRMTLEGRDLCVDSFVDLSEGEAPEGG